MLFLLILSFYSEFEWHEVKRASVKVISEEIKESPMGGSRIEKRFIFLNSGIFRGGCRVVFSKGTGIERLPRGLKFMKRAIKAKKFDRYSALYEEGELKQEWERLEKQSANMLGVSSLSLEELKRFLPSEDSREATGNMELKLKDKRKPGKKYPSKTYYSFVEIKENRMIKLVPIVIRLCPIEEVIEEYMNSMEGG